MKLTRRTLKAINTQLQAQLTACAPESRKGLKAKLAATRSENEGLKLQNESLTKKLQAASEQAASEAVAAA